MSAGMEIYPEIILRFQGFHLAVRNPTSVDQDITVKFESDGVTIMTITVSGVKPMQVKDAPITWEMIKGAIEPYLDEPIAVYPEIPAPVAGVYLVGSTTTSPGTRGGAIAVMWTSSSAKITLLDEEERPVAGAQLLLYNVQTGKCYKYISDDSGVFTLPRFVTGTHGYWIAEMMKIDYERRLLIYACVPNYTFEDITVRGEWVDRLKLDAEFKVEPGTFRYVLERICDVMPEPFKSVVQIIAGTWGWLEEKTANMILTWLAHYASHQSGVRISSLIYDPDKEVVKATFTIAPFESPLVIPGAIVAFLKFLAGIFLAWTGLKVVGAVVGKYLDWKVTEERRKIEEQRTAQIDRLTEARAKELIGKEAYDKAVANVTESAKYLAGQTPKTWLERYGVPLAVGAGGAVVGAIASAIVIRPV